MGAALAGVFCGVLVGRLLAGGTSMAAVCCDDVFRVKIVWRMGASDLRGGYGVHLLIADWLRHLGSAVMSIYGWRVVEGSGSVVGEPAAEMFGGLRKPLRKVIAPLLRLVSARQECGSGGNNDQNCARTATAGWESRKLLLGREAEAAVVLFVPSAPWQ